MSRHKQKESPVETGLEFDQGWKATATFLAQVVSHEKILHTKKSCLKKGFTRLGRHRPGNSAGRIYPERKRNVFNHPVVEYFPKPDDKTGEAGNKKGQDLNPTPWYWYLNKEE
jgi:hypothetical protein